MSSATLLLPIEYRRNAIQAIRRAKNRVLLLAMVFTDDTSTDELIDALNDAAMRGVNVRIAADIFTYGKFGGHLRPHKFFTKQSRLTTAMVRELEKSGVKFSWLGRFTFLPLTGRNHMKALLVDDVTYSFGGINVDEESFENNDCMFKFQNAQLTSTLYDAIVRIIEADGRNFSYRSYGFDVDRNSRVLIDGGLQGDSMIFRRACELAEAAEKITYVSQYGPTGRLAKILKQKDTRFYFNAPQNATESNNRLIIRFGLFFHKLHTLYERKKYLHAKFILFTMPNGKIVAISGSFNFIWGSVLFGTREIALETSDRAIVSQLHKFFERHVQ